MKPDLIELAAEIESILRNETDGPIEALQVLALLISGIILTQRNPGIDLRTCINSFWAAFRPLVDGVLISEQGALDS